MKRLCNKQAYIALVDCLVIIIYAGIVNVLKIYNKDSLLIYRLISTIVVVW